MPTKEYRWRIERSKGEEVCFVDTAIEVLGHVLHVLDGNPWHMTGGDEWNWGIHAHPDLIFVIFLSDPSPIIVYPCHSLTHSLTD